MRKRRKVLIILCLMAVAAVCFVTLQPRNEPKYQGRYLSQWLELYWEALPNEKDELSAQRADAERAVRAIGTNALPYFLKWLHFERSAWQRTIRRSLPRWAEDHPTVDRWLDGAAGQRANCGLLGMRILGTNAVTSVPELKAMLYDRTNTMSAGIAISALAYVGEPAIPVLRAALADTNNPGRASIISGFLLMVYEGHTNTCLPLIVEALKDEDATVRMIATNTVQFVAPQLLTNVAAQQTSASPR